MFSWFWEEIMRVFDERSFKKVQGTIVFKATDNQYIFSIQRITGLFPLEFFLQSCIKYKCPEELHLLIPFAFWFVDFRNFRVHIMRKLWSNYFLFPQFHLTSHWVFFKAIRLNNHTAIQRSKRNWAVCMRFGHCWVKNPFP